MKTLVFWGLLFALVFTGSVAFGDLDVTLIERYPRYDYDAVKNNPEPGDIVTFKGHIINWSQQASEVEYVWLIDGELAQEDATEIAGGAEEVVELEWMWAAGDHTVELIADPYDMIAELSEDNNSIEDHINAIIAGFWVEQSVYDYFHDYQHELGIGANSWQDWIQRQMAIQNELYESAIWELSPDGVLDRVRIDKIIVVPDGALPLNGGLASNNPDLSDKTVDLMWGFSKTLLNGDFYARHTEVSEHNPFYLERSLIHELGHARYLIDCYGFDISNTESHHAVQIWEGDTYVAGSEYMPFIAWDVVLYYNKSGGVMTGPYDFNWSPYEAAALNLIAGQRAKCGNCNAPCNIGVFLQDLPQNNHVRFVDQGGKPWAGANVRIYEAEAGPGWYGKTIDNTWDQQYGTDENGYIHLPRNPFNPGGNIIHTYGNANSVMVLRIGFGEQIWYRVMEVSDFNMEYWRGNTDDGYYEIELEGLNYVDEEPPTVPQGLEAYKVRYDDITLRWQESTDDIGVLRYKIYRDGELIGESQETVYRDKTVSSCMNYSYTVSACDAFNESEQSPAEVVAVPGRPQKCDLNEDHKIDLLDFGMMCCSWLVSGCEVVGDFDADGVVNLIDYKLFSDYYLTPVDDEFNWPMRQRDMFHTGRANYIVPASRMNDTFFDNIQWQKPSPGNLSATSMSFYANVGPDGQDVIVGGYHWPKGVQGMDRESGKLLWQDNPSGGETIARVTPAFSADGQTIYVVNDSTGGHPLMAFDTLAGPETYWHNGGDVEPDHLSKNNPTIGPDGMIWLHQWNSRPYAGMDNGDSLSLSWSAATGIHTCYSDPTLYEDDGNLMVVSGGREFSVKAWDGTTGEQLWSTYTGIDTDGTATIDPDNGNIYLGVGMDKIKVVGLDKNGEPLWDNPVMEVYNWPGGTDNRQRVQSAGCLSYDGATYYFQSNANDGSGQLYAINTDDGSVKWSFATGSRGWEIDSSSPIVTINGVIIVGNNFGDKYWAILDNGNSGLELDSIAIDEAGNAQGSATVSADGMLYLPLRTQWTVSNGDGDIPTGQVANVFTAFDIN
ncbi:MAG: PQQ-binding-like beta-propeller repeat protein [Phycisphaerae bacterium]|nr:PQQ-binding-like beta-propeller repeat protein [Phycisphaerae bacterium]